MLALKNRPGSDMRWIRTRKTRTGSEHTVCPRSSDPFYIVTYYIKLGSVLPGNIVCFTVVWSGQDLGFVLYCRPKNS